MQVSAVDIGKGCEIGHEFEEFLRPHCVSQVGPWSSSLGGRFRGLVTAKWCLIWTLFLLALLGHATCPTPSISSPNVSGDAEGPGFSIEQQWSAAYWVSILYNTYIHIYIYII